MSPVLCRNVVPAWANTARAGRACGQRLLDMDPDALLPGKRISVKCDRCKHVTVITGAQVPDPIAALERAEAA